MVTGSSIILVPLVNHMSAAHFVFMYLTNGVLHDKGRMAKTDWKQKRKNLKLDFSFM